MGSKSEEFVIELRDRVSGAAKAAKTATAELAERMLAAREAAGSLEGKLLAASAKLATLQDAAGGVATEAQTNAIKRQEAAVTALKAALDQKGGDLGALAAAQGLAVEADAMRAAKDAADALATAQTKLATAERIAATATANASALSAEDQAAEHAAATWLKLDAAQKKFAQDNASMVQAAMQKTADAAAKNDKATQQAAGGADSFFNAVQGGAGPMGGMIGRARSLTSALGKGGAAGALVAVAAAAVVFVVAIIAAAIALAKFALTSADAARSQRLVTEGLAVSSKSLANLGTILPQVQASTGLAADQIRGLAQQLDAAGVSAANMPEALNALATATAGGASAEFIKKLNDGLKATGHVLPELQGQMAKLGEIAKEKSRSLPALAERFHANIAGLFSGLQLDGFLKGLEKMVKLFDANTASGRALKFLAEKLLQPLIDAATTAFPYVERGFLLGVAGALMLYIAVKKVQNALKDMGVSASTAGGGTGLDLAAAASRLDSSQSADAAKLAGKSMADGTAQGVLDGIPGVVAAVTQMGNTAVATLHTVLDAHSPSRRFRAGALTAPQGAVEGIEAGTPAVKKAVAKMVDVPSDMSAPSGSGGAARGGEPHLEFNNCSFGGDLNEGTLRRWLRNILSTEQLSAEPA